LTLTQAGGEVGEVLNAIGGDEKKAATKKKAAATKKK
jgi:hypothetical protein